MVCLQKQLRKETRKPENVLRDGVEGLCLGPTTQGFKAAVTAVTRKGSLHPEPLSRREGMEEGPLR